MYAGTSKVLSQADPLVSTGKETGRPYLVHQLRVPVSCEEEKKYQKYKLLCTFIGDTLDESFHKKYRTQTTILANCMAA